MVTTKSRNLFAAILIARAICGVGVAQAGWEVTGTTTGGGNVVLGTDTCSGLTNYLGTNYNAVTLDISGSSLESLPFVASNMTSSAGSILGNSFTNNGTVNVSGVVPGDDAQIAVLFKGYDVSGNTVTNTSGGAIYSNNPGMEADGIEFYAFNDATGNTVTNAGTIEAYQNGIAILAGDTLSGNVVNNMTGGTIDASGSAIYLEGNHVSGGSVTNSGTLNSFGSAIYIYGNDDVTDVQVTNTSGGQINGYFSAGIYIEADSLVTGTSVTNAGSIDASGTAVYLGASKVTDNTVMNTGAIESYDGTGIYLDADSGLTGNTVTNASGGTITAEYSGVYLYSEYGDVTDNTLANNLGATITAGDTGLGIEADYGNLTRNVVTNDGTISAESGIYVYGGGEASYNTVTNSGTVTGTEIGIDVEADDTNLDHNKVTNSGTIISMTYDTSSNPTGGGTGIYLNADDSSASYNTVTNTSTGTIISYEDGIYIEAYESVNNNTVTNDGTIDASQGGDGIYFYSDEQDMNANVVQNSGTIKAAYDGIEMYADYGNLEGNTVTLTSDSKLTVGGDGVYLYANYTVSGNTVSNAGLIDASEDGSGIGLYSENDAVTGNSVANSGAISAYGTGIYLDAEESVRSNTVENSGSISSMDASGTEGIELYSDSSDVDVNVVTNTATGTIKVGYEGTGILLYAAGSCDDNEVTNAGAISAEYDAVGPTITGAGVMYLSGIGIDLWGYEHVQGNSVLNSGSITLGDDSVGIGLWSFGDVSGNTVTNSGDITAGIESVGITLASQSFNNLDNVVKNSGTITISDGSGCGIFVTAPGNVNGNEVTNSGDIYVGTGLDTSANADVTAAGIAIGSMGFSSGSIYNTTVSGNTVTNAGTIDVELADLSGDVFTAGIVVGRANYMYTPLDLASYSSVVSDNTITNSGTINVLVTDPSANNMDIAGIAVISTYGADPSVISGNTIVNTETGVINTGTEYGDGIVIYNVRGEARNQAEEGSSYGTFGNTITNAGEITAGWDGIYAYDEYGDFYDNTILNSGTINAAGGDGIYIGAEEIHGNAISNPGTINAENAGINLWADDGGVYDNAISNSGTIDVTGDYGYGLVLWGSSEGTGNTIVNSGTIDVEMTSGAYGMALWGTNDSEITNTGTIAAATGTYSAYGIDLSGSGNTLTNWGTISATTTDVSGGNAYGVDIGGDDNTLTNWGVISATTTDASGTAVGIYVSGTGNVVNLEGHSAVYGKIQGIADASGNAVNTLNLDFTGLTSAEIAEIEAAVAAYNASDKSTDLTFTVRGVTYVVDPMIVNTNLLSYQLQGLTGNQSAVGANLDSLATNPDPDSDFANLLNAVDNSGDVPKALDMLSPQRYQLYGDIAVATMSGIGQEVDHRLMALYDGEMPERRGNLWMTGSHKSATVDATSHDLEDAKFDTNTVVVGADYRVNPNVTLGALFHYSQTDNAKMDEHGSRVDVDGRGVGIYAGYREGGVYVNGLLTYSTNDYKSQRKVKFTGYNHTAKGDTNGDQTGFGVDGGYDFKVSDALTVGPFVGMQYVHLNVDGFRETGAPGANLKVSEQSMTSMLGRVGARLNYTSGMFSTDLHAALQHEFANDSRDITAQFIGSGLDAFSVKTTDPERNSFLLGVGLNWNFGRTMVYANYDMQGGQSSWHEQNIKGGVKISF